MSAFPSSIHNFTPEQLVDFLENCKHEALIMREVRWNGITKEIPPVIMLANDDDGHYTQVFRNRSELNVFIDHLQSVANELWPHEGDSSIVAESTVPTTFAMNTSSPPASKITFDVAQQEIAYFDSNGFFYKGQLIEDAGEAHRLLLEVLNAQKQEAAVS